MNTFWENGTKTSFHILQNWGLTIASLKGVMTDFITILTHAECAIALGARPSLFFFGLSINKNDKYVLVHQVSWFIGQQISLLNASN